jgi:hypothetical protein
MVFKEIGYENADLTRSAENQDSVAGKGKAKFSLCLAN